MLSGSPLRCMRLFSRHSDHLDGSFFDMTQLTMAETMTALLKIGELADAAALSTKACLISGALSIWLAVTALGWCSVAPQILLQTLTIRYARLIKTVHR